MIEDSTLQLEIVRRLDVLIKLLIEYKPELSRERTAREQIGKLSGLGLSPSEIARIMGIPTSHVGAQLSQIRNKKGEKKK
jgi:hypothetical protein